MGLEQYSKAVQETAQNLRIIDDALFRLVAEQKLVCQEILRTLLDMPELMVESVTAQSVLKSMHREVTLDAHCIVKGGKHVDIEMQKGSGNDDILRTRFHASALTAAYTPKGTEFSDIPEVAIVYITEYDALGNGQIFTHVKRCMETGKGYVPVTDREDIYFASTAVKDESDRSRLLQLFLRKDAFEDKAYPELSRAVTYFKTTEGGYEKVCKTVEDYAKAFAKDYAEDYGRQCRIEGRREGWREGQENLISRMLSSGKTPEEIAEFTGIALEEVEAVEASLCAEV